MTDAATLRLPVGVRGFFVAGASPRPRVNPKTFTTACHFVARETGRSAVEPSSRPLVSSYLSMDLVGSDTIRVVCNATYPLIAFAIAKGDGELSLSFVDRPEVAAVFEQLSDFQPLTAAWLTSDLTAQATVDLDAVELDQFRYWRPSILGDVVFNLWD